MTIFDTRYEALIKELTQIDAPVLRHKEVTFVTLSLQVNGTTVWTSVTEELRSFKPKVPRSLNRYPRDQRSWVISFDVRSVDGLGSFSESFLLIYEEEDRKSVAKRARGRISLSRLRFPEAPSSQLFDRNNRTTNIFRHASRARIQKIRVASDSAYVPYKRYRKKKPDLPITDGSVVENRLTNFIRQEDGTVMTDNLGSHVVTLRSRSSVRTGTPNFFKLRKSERPVNPYTMSESISSTRQGIETVKTADQSVVTSLSWMGPTEYFQVVPAPDYTVSSESDNKAYKKLLANLDLGLNRESAQAPTNIVQFRQVVNMIATNATKIRRSYSALKRLDFKSAEKALFGTRKPRYRKGGKLSAARSLSQNWLELQYGWKPLLHDIKAITDSLHREYHGDIRSVRGVGVTSVTAETDVLGPRKVSLATVSPFPVGKQVVVRTSRVEYGLRYAVSDQDRVTLAQTGFLSPISLAWEVIPFSFVVDWFYPVGPYLESLAAFEGMSFVDGYKTTFVREQLGILISCNNELRGTFPQRVFITSRGGLQRTSVRLQRVKLTTFPSHPRILLKNPISIGHAANAVALLVANFKR